MTLSESNGTVRKVVCLGMPSYGSVTDRAAMGFYRPSRDPGLDVRVMAGSSSLATGNMNGVWVQTLNMNRKTPVAYFAMQHTDIEPEEFWLDKLIAELEAKQLDVLGVVAPIKDARGVTSTALARDDGDTWRVHGRLTMHEVWRRLPETFTSEDVGRPLLINTGLWVCKFREEWAQHIFFTVNDRIMIDPKTGDYHAQIEPEDWFVSRLYHELGLRVGCTRKVRLEHRGTMAFTNEIPWGQNEYDKEYLPGSALDDCAPVDWFPHDCAGWLTEAEGQELARLAAGKVVLEVGSYCGRSTVCLARDAVSVSAVDTFDGRGTSVPGDTYALFTANLKRHGVHHKVTAYRSPSVETLSRLPPVFDLVFVDGSHDRESVLADAHAAAAVVKPGGLLVFHDYQTDGNPGVTEAVDEFLTNGAELVGRVGSLAIVRPPALIPLEASHA